MTAEKQKKCGINKQCEEIEELEKHHNSKEVHAKVKELWRNNKYNNNNGCIMDKEGNLLSEEEDIAIRWKEYITELYDDNRAEMPKFAMTTDTTYCKKKYRRP